MQKAERILFSKRIVMADLEVAAIEQSKNSILQQKQEYIKVDNANKNLLTPVNNLIDIYHNELGRYTGIFRLSLTEPIIQNAASLNVGNELFPNDINSTPPSILPKKTWVHVKPFALNRLVGKQYLETYPATDLNAEIHKINDAISTISTITAEPLINRVTGQKCVTTMPGPTYTIQTYAGMHTWLNGLKNVVTHLQSYVATTVSAIHTSDTDPTRAAQASAAVSNANTFLAALSTWMAYPDFNTSHGQTTCPGFNSYNPALLGNTKLQLTPLNVLTAALNNRLTFLNTTRVPQIDGYLGSLSQDMNTGEVTGSGFYLQRYNFLLLRLNRLGGSLFKVKGSDTAINAQIGLQSAAQNDKNTYSTLLRVTTLTAPSNGTNAVVIKDSSGFSVGDSVYLVSDSQDELFAKITAIEPNNRLRLSIDIPPTYFPAEMARIYKVI